MKVGNKVNKYKERYMQIPKTVEQMILRRERLAIQLDDAMNALDHWLDKNGINTEECDTHGGVEVYVNPSDSAERIRQAILGK